MCIHHVFHICFNRLKNNSKLISYAGFTLVEVMIVVTISGILAVAGFVSVRSLVEDMKYRSAVDDLTMAFQVARSRVMANPVRLCGIYGDSAGYLVFYDDNRNGIYDTLTDTKFKAYSKLPKGIKFFVPGANALPNNTVIFRGDGSADRSGGIGIRKGDSKGKEIHVNKITGTITIVKEN